MIRWNEISNKKLLISKNYSQAINYFVQTIVRERFVEQNIIHVKLCEKINPAEKEPLANILSLQRFVIRERLNRVSNESFVKQFDRKCVIDVKFYTKLFLVK